MEIYLYHTTSPDNRMIKYLDRSLQLTGSLRDVSNVVNPKVLIEGNIADLLDLYNYAYIPSFNRYYFIDDMQSYRNNVILLSLTVDVLFSFKDEILDNVAIVDKVQKRDDANLYYDDGSFITDSRDFYTIKTFENGFNDVGEFILITAGGADYSNNGGGS